MTSDEDRTTARGLARYAREYFEAALAADKKIGRRDGYEICAPAPVNHMTAHSIELILKAYLRHQGYSLSEIKALGHDLEKCWEHSVRNGIDSHVPLNDDDIHILKVLNALHKSNELKYIKTGPKTFPVYGPLQTLTEDLLDAVCPLVGYR